MDVFTLVGKLTLEGIDKTEKQLTGLRGQIEKHRKAIALSFVAIGAAAIGAAISSVKAFMDIGDEVQKMAIKTGFSTEALSEFRHAAELSGSSLAGLEVGIRVMQRSIYDASQGLSTATDALNALGLSVSELQGIAPEKQFEIITNALAGVQDTSLKAALAQKLFGRSGTDLLPMLADGSEGLKAMREEAHKLGIVFTQEAADSAAEFQDQMTRLKGIMNGVQFTLAKELLPSLEAGIPILQDWVRWLGPVIENTLNWHAAYDKQIAQRKAWDTMMLERQRALGGLTNEYEKSVIKLEAVLKSTNQWNEQSENTIGKLREEIKERGFHKEAVEGQNQALQEQLDLQKEQEEAYKKLTDQIKDILIQYQYERSEAGKLGLSVQDVQFAFLDLGGTQDELIGIMERLGDESDNVNAWLRILGYTAQEVNSLMEKQKAAVDGVAGAFKAAKPEVHGMNEALLETTGMAMTSTASLDELKAAITGTIGAAREAAILAYQRAKYGYSEKAAANVAERRAAEEAGGNVFQHGGLITEPTWLTKIGEYRPYGVMAEKRPEWIVPTGQQGKQMMTLIMEVDGRQMAKAVMPYAIGEIRLRTGVKI